MPQPHKSLALAFVATTDWSSTELRGRIIAGLIQHAYGGAVVTTVVASARAWSQRASFTAEVESEVAPLGRNRTLVCVLIKFPHPDASEICRRHGAALVLLDCVDNEDCSVPALLQSPSMLGGDQIDGLLLQTEQHAGWVRQLAPRAMTAVLPHPHFLQAR